MRLIFQYLAGSDPGTGKGGSISDGRMGSGKALKTTLAAAAARKGDENVWDSSYFRKNGTCEPLLNPVHFSVAEKAKSACNICTSFSGQHHVVCLCWQEALSQLWWLACIHCVFQIEYIQLLISHFTNQTDTALKTAIRENCWWIVADTYECLQTDKILRPAWNEVWKNWGETHLFQQSSKFWALIWCADRSGKVEKCRTVRCQSFRECS